MQLGSNNADRGADAMTDQNDGSRASRLPIFVPQCREGHIVETSSLILYSRIFALASGLRERCAVFRAGTVDSNHW